MPSLNDKLGASLEVLGDLQRNGKHVFTSSEISRTHRDRLKKAGFVAPIINGWWMATDPAARPGDTTAWYAYFWDFCSRYCHSRFGDAWHLSPEHSLLIQAGVTEIPSQVVVHASGGTNNDLDLPFGTSLFDYKVPSQPAAHLVTERDGLRLLATAAALVRVPPAFYRSRPVEAQVSLARIRDASDLLSLLLEGDHTVVAGRLAGAFRRMGRSALADEISETMSRAGHRVRERDPFQADQALVEIRATTPTTVARIQGMWESMRGVVVESFPGPPPSPDPASYLGQVEALYDRDAYHSLSIEGYRVTPELVERIRSGAWDPEHENADRETRDALAARGYWLAFQGVKNAVETILAEPAAAVTVVREQHRAWYRDLFQPAVDAGILDAAQLAGYRSHPVYIQNSRHVPPRSEAVRDAMPALFDLLEQEEHAAVRAVLGHWLFGYLHPFPDGNGRIARFLMNTMLASGGYPWTVIRTDERQIYMRALEAASVDQDIRVFADFLSDAVRRAATEFS